MNLTQSQPRYGNKARPVIRFLRSSFLPRNLVIMIFSDMAVDQGRRVDVGMEASDGQSVSTAAAAGAWAERAMGLFSQTGAGLEAY